MIPKLIYPGDDYDPDSQESELNDKDQFEHHKSVSEEW